MKKKLLIAILAVLFLVILACIVVQATTKTIGPNTVLLDDIQVDDSSVSFNFSHANTLLYLKGYKYNVGDDGVLTISFSGTPFRFLKIKSSAYHIVIKNVSNVKRIDVKGSNGSTKTFWNADLN